MSKLTQLGATLAVLSGQALASVDHRWSLALDGNRAFVINEARKGLVIDTSGVAAIERRVENRAMESISSSGLKGEAIAPLVQVLHDIETVLAQAKNADIEWTDPLDQDWVRVGHSGYTRSLAPVAHVELDTSDECFGRS